MCACMCACVCVCVCVCVSERERPSSTYNAFVIYSLIIFTVTGPSPPLPLLPTAFQTKVEANFINKQTTKILEEYYDGLNNRAAGRLFRNNTMNHILFDYKNSQIVYVTGIYILPVTDFSCSC